MVRSRGYSTTRYPTLETGYYNATPSELQISSYDAYFIKLVKSCSSTTPATSTNRELVQKILHCGISPNPCNSHSESLVHTICRCGDVALLQCMIDAGSCMTVCDDYGRTPLHDACWFTGNNSNDDDDPNKNTIFDIVALLLQNSSTEGTYMFYMTDCRGYAPLQYVTKQYWRIWIEWLEANKDIYWPRRNKIVDGEQAPSPLSFVPPNTIPTPIPAKPLSPELAHMVVSGRIKPEEAVILREMEPPKKQTPMDDSSKSVDEDTDDTDDDSDTYDESESDSDDDIDELTDSFDDDDDDDSLFDEDMANIIRYAKEQNRRVAATTTSVA